MGVAHSKMRSWRERGDDAILKQFTRRLVYTSYRHVTKFNITVIIVIAAFGTVFTVSCSLHCEEQLQGNR